MSKKTFVAIDPASYSLGLCLVQDGKIKKTYTVMETSGSIAIRCAGIVDQIRKLKLPKIDKLYVEVLNTRTHRRTLWSIGAILGGLGKFCDDKTTVTDNALKMKSKATGKKIALLNPRHWQSYFKVEKYRSGDKDKDAKILRAFKKRFPKRKVKSADEAVAIFLATIVLEEGPDGKS